MTDTQLLEVLRSSAKFLYDEGAGEGAVAVDEAYNRLILQDALITAAEAVLEELQASDDPVTTDAFIRLRLAVEAFKEEAA